MPETAADRASGDPTDERVPDRVGSIVVRITA
jgi:hypothetical protein